MLAPALPQSVQRPIAVHAMRDPQILDLEILCRRSDEVSPHSSDFTQTSQVRHTLLLDVCSAVTCSAWLIKAACHMKVLPCFGILFGMARSYRSEVAALFDYSQVDRTCANLVLSDATIVSMFEVESLQCVSHLC